MTIPISVYLLLYSGSWFGCLFDCYVSTCLFCILIHPAVYWRFPTSCILMKTSRRCSVYFLITICFTISDFYLRSRSQQIICGVANEIPPGLLHSQKKRAQTSWLPQRNKLPLYFVCILNSIAQFIIWLVIWRVELGMMVSTNPFYPRFGDGQTRALTIQRELMLKIFLSMY